jgi:hypothetical protein
MQRIEPIKQHVAVGKDAFMCFMRRRFDMNLGKISAKNLKTAFEKGSVPIDVFFTIKDRLLLYT